MANAAAISPWSVKTSKRRVDGSTGKPTKRQRLSAGPSTSKERQRQQTLTQIQWVPSAQSWSFEDGDVSTLDYIDSDDSFTSSERKKRSRSFDDGRKKERAQLGGKTPSLKKRNSTLTQMVFFNIQTPLDIGEDDYLRNDTLPSSDETSTVDCTGKMHSRVRLPQTDGTYESPRKPRPKRQANIDLSERKSEDMSDDEYRPTKRKKPVIESEQDATRKSSRHRTRVLSNPAQNLQYFEEAFQENSRNTPSVLDQNRMSPKVQKAIIQDSDGNQEKDNNSPELRKRVNIPETPQKRKNVIPSSQSPESLPPSTRKKPVIDLVSPARLAPLEPQVEILANSAGSPRKSDKVDHNDPISALESTASPSPKRKAAILKLQKKTPQIAKLRVEDSQRDIWNIPVTSSPRPEKYSPEFQRALAPKDNTVAGGKIAESSQSQFGLDRKMLSGSEESLESLKDIFGIRQRAENQTDKTWDAHDLSPQISGESGVAVKDFAQEVVSDATPRESFNQLVRAASDLARTLSMEGGEGEGEGEADEDDEESAFGTPIANDTQFNFELADRILSTPIPMTPLKPPAAPKDDKSDKSPGISDKNDLDSFPLPSPTLFRNSTTTRVPLNDMIPSSSASSVLPTRQFSSQLSVHPASMPNQSQISTQEPTQEYHPMSSVQPFAALTPSPEEEADHITIKDSSSISIPLSQMPAYNGKDGDDDGDLDLDLDLDNFTDGCVPNEEVDDNISEDEKEEQVEQLQELEQPLVPMLPPTAAAIQDVGLLSLEQLILPTNAPQPELPPPIHSQVAEEDTQSNFTQGGHVTASRIARMKAQGLIPQDYVPRPDFRVPTDPRELLPAWAFEGLESSDEEDEA